MAGQISSSENGEIIEQPLSTEVYERLPEPQDSKISVIASEKVKKWRSRIAASRKVREEKFKNLNVLIDFYEGIQWHLENTNVPILKDKTTINLIFSNIKKELPYLYFQNPTPIISATRNEFELGAFSLQELLKSYTKYNLGTELKKHVRLAVLDAKFTFGCLKVSYTPKFGINKNYGRPIIIDTINNIPIFQQDETGNIILDNDDKILVSELYYIERISPREFLIDVTCRNFIERAGWLGQEVVKPLKYLKDNSLYKNTDRLTRNIEWSDLFNNTFKKTTEEIQASKEFIATEDTQLVRFVEIYDLENKELLCLPDDGNEFIREEEGILNPFSILKFNESPDNFYPVSDVAQEKPVQEEVNVSRSLEITHMRRSARKYFYSEDTFRGIDDKEGIEAMKDPEDLTLVKVAEYDKPPAPIQGANQDATVYNGTMKARMDFNEVSGGTEASRGLSERRKTGEEAGYQESHLVVRRTDKQSLIADFITDAYKKLAFLMQQTLTIPQAIKVEGKDAVFWAEVKNTDIQGEFHFNIEVSELQPQIPEIMRRELNEFITVLTQFVTAILSNPVGPMVFNVQGTIAELAKSYPNINVEKMLNTQVTPTQIASAVMMQLKQGNNNAPI